LPTYTPKPSDIQRAWYVVDADGLVLGRVATEVARILRGKHKAMFTPHLDTGDHVIVINADKAILTGNKEQQKMYRRHSGYPGGLTEIRADKMRAIRPIKMVEEAIKGMLPKTKMGKQMYRKLKVYAGEKHPHDAQQPTALAAR
jgi:large subunit ribosomal protein L13